MDCNFRSKNVSLPTFIRTALAVFFLLTLLTPSVQVRAELRWYWEDDFTATERTKLRSWITETSSALERYVGPFPFDVHVHFHRAANSDEPVPWANTWRAGKQSINFHVDPIYSLDEFRDDWTAPHELSHLILPYLGRSNAWFAEGFASYLQFSVMVEAGIIDEAEAIRRREKRMLPAIAPLHDADMPLPDYMPELKRRGAYPTFYWGGSIYFERVDMQLQAQGSSLQEALRDFLTCCRMQRRSLDDLTGELDRLVGSRVFSEELLVIRSTPGMPERPSGP
ncbi:MAG: hypothetical protein AAGG55_03835 [Pseudomonadota bacterium]